MVLRLGYEATKQLTLLGREISTLFFFENGNKFLKMSRSSSLASQSAVPNSRTGSYGGISMSIVVKTLRAVAPRVAYHVST